MKDELEIIKTRTIFLKAGEFSEDIVLVDKDGDGDIYFTFGLKYVLSEKSDTHFDIKDAHHAVIEIETKPNAITRLETPYKLGTYGKDRELLINFIVQPKNADDTHNITITFYATKQ